MKALLDNAYAPLTFSWGLIESPFLKLSEAFLQWKEQLDARFGTHTRHERFRAPLSESLRALEPLTTPLNRYLLTETRSGWCAIFANGLRVNDVASPVVYLPTVLGCRGLEIACVPDRSRTSDREALQIYGAVSFSLYGRERTDWLNRIRRISVSNDVSGWIFAAEGEVQPYEQAERYAERRIANRFTPVMLEHNCAALGIDLFNSDFYGPQSLLLKTTGQKFSGPSMSLADARAHAQV